MTTDYLLRVLSLFPLFAFVSGASHASSPAGDPVSWRSLKHVQVAVGVTNYTWDGDSLCLSNGQHHVRFYAGRKKADVDGTVVWLNAPLEGAASNESWRVAGVDLDFLQLAILPRAEGKAKPLRILLDPGHGGADDGASSKPPAVKEKDLTLALAKRIGAHLKKAGLHVDYTRTSDVTLPLGERSYIARKKKADVFISIHANHASNADASGVETYVLPPSGFPGTAEGTCTRSWHVGNRNDFHNTLLGFSIHRHLAAISGATDRGLKRQSFFVLRETACPAVLLEFGFLSNAAEAHRMLCGDWQEENAAAVVAGIAAYARKAEALDRAVAEKRQQDAEANERWRRHLAAQAEKADPPPSAGDVDGPTCDSSPPSKTEPSGTLPKTIFDFYLTNTSQER